MRADKIKNKPVDWLWKERIPRGMITVIAGRPGSSKSLLACRIAADISRAGGNVLLSCAEDTQSEMIGPRLDAARAVKRRIEVDMEPVLPEDIEALTKFVKRYKVKLVILDPINVHLSTGVSRYNDSVRKATNPLKRLGVETGCSFILFDHVLKNVAKSAHPLSAIGGASSGLSSAARMAYIVGRDPHDRDRVILGCAKPNLREMPAELEFIIDEREVPEVDTMATLIDGEECEFDIMELLAKPGKQRGRPPSKREAAIEWLVEYLKNAPKYEWRAAEVIEDAKQFRITKRTLDGAKADAGIMSEKRGKEWWWRLPKDLIATIEGEDEDS